MTRSAAVISVIVAVSVLMAGCASADPVEAPHPESSAVGGGATTIEDAWAKAGCSTAEPTTASIHPVDPPKPLTRTGTCTPYDGGEHAFFYEFPSSDQALEWVSTGRIEEGTEHGMFIDGAIVIVAYDADTAQRFAEIFPAADPAA